MQTRRRGGVYSKPSRKHPRKHPRSSKTYRRPYQRGYVGKRDRYAIEASLHPSLRHGLELWRHPSKKEREFDQMREQSKKAREEKEAREVAMQKAIKQHERSLATRKKEMERLSIQTEKRLKSVQQSLNREARVSRRNVTRHAMMQRIQEEFERKRNSLAMAGMANALNEAMKAHEYDQVMSMLSGMKIEPQAAAQAAHAAPVLGWTPIRFNDNSNDD